MRTKTIKRYQYDELSDSAKAKARDWYREASAGDNVFADSVIEDFATIAEFCGWDIRQRRVQLMNGSHRYDPVVYWSGFWNQGDGACFEGSFDAAKVDAAKLKEHAPEDKELHRLADEFAELAAEYSGLVASVKHSGQYYHEHCTEFAVDLPGPDIVYMSPEWDQHQANARDAEHRLVEASRELMRWCYRSLEAEWNYQNSDEQVAESIRANEYEFTEDGERA